MIDLIELAIKAVIVACLLLPFVLIFKLIKFLANRKHKNNMSNNSNWYGICENCGKKDGLHRLNGERYCALCHAKLKAEKYALKLQENGKNDGH